MAAMDCPALCAPDAGQPGTPVAVRCFSEAALMAAVAEEMGGEDDEVEAPDAPEPTASGLGAKAVPVVAATSPAPFPRVARQPATATTVATAVSKPVGPETLASLISRSCARATTCGCEKKPQATCEADSARDGAAGGAALFTCLIDLDCAAICDPKAGEPGTAAYTRCVEPVIQRIRAEAAAGSAGSDAAYRTRMGIINNFPTGGGKRRFYDSAGRLIREE
jgi:hypothetical protein